MKKQISFLLMSLLITIQAFTFGITFASEIPNDAVVSFKAPSGYVEASNSLLSATKKSAGSKESFKIVRSSDGKSLYFFSQYNKKYVAPRTSNSTSELIAKESDRDGHKFQLVHKSGDDYYIKYVQNGKYVRVNSNNNLVADQSSSKKATLFIIKNIGSISSNDSNNSNDNNSNDNNSNDNNSNDSNNSSGSSHSIGSYSIITGVNTSTGSKSISTIVDNGMYQLVVVGASTGKTGRNTPMDNNLMKGQRFKLIGLEGDQDKKIEVWIRKKEGSDSNKIKVPGCGSSKGKNKDLIYSILTLKDKSLDLSNFNVTNSSKGVSKFSGNNTKYDIKAPSGNNFKIMAIFFDDPAKVIDAKGGKILTSINRNGSRPIGDEDGMSILLYDKGVKVPDYVDVFDIDGSKNGNQVVSVGFSPK